MIRLQGFRIIELGQVKNPRWPRLLKIAKITKSTSSPVPIGIIGYKFTWNLGIQNCKSKKITAELGHRDLLSVYKSNFTQMPISQENMNVYLSDSITMVPEWNHFIFMQIDNPRWPPGAIAKNSTNTKMTISQEPKDEIDSVLCQNVSCMKLFCFFEWNHFKFMQTDYPRWPSGAVTKNCINTKMTISQEPLVEIDPSLCQNASCMKPF